MLENAMLSTYITRQLSRARYKLLSDGSYFGEVPALRGVWASASSLERCREQLREVLEDWLLLKLRDHDAIPGLRLPRRLPQRRHRRAYA